MRANHDVLTQHCSGCHLLALINCCSRAIAQMAAALAAALVAILVAILVAVMAAIGRDHVKYQMLNKMIVPQKGFARLQ